ncbi:MAG TPA: hypothetical protein VKO38_06380 [Wenzhouxiangella sp.]|nr:hypothetical protein [Wenzhouxiangella sp.]
MMRSRIRASVTARVVAGLTCIALCLWTISPSTSHIPKVVETLQQHAEMIASHGHSHGFEEDLIWAMHGHSHDVADHDHSQAVLTQARPDATAVETSTTWQGRALAYWSAPLFLLERPPRV